MSDIVSPIASPAPLAGTPSAESVRGGPLAGELVHGAPLGAEPSPGRADNPFPGGTVRRGLLALVGDGTTGRPRMPMLTTVIDHLTSSLTTSFRNLSRGGTEVRADQPRPVRFAEFVETVPPTALIAVLGIGPWNGRCLAVIDAGLANAAISLLLGDRGGLCPGQLGLAAQPERRAYTAIERAIVERLARDQIAAGLTAAFAVIGALDAELDHMVSDIAEAAIVPPAAACLTWRVAISLESQEGECQQGAISFLLPLASVEPIRARLSQAPSGPGLDPAWRTHLRSELPHAGITVRAVIERRRISATEVLRWRIGSMLPLNRHHDEPIDVLCEDLLVFRARMAEQGGRIALHIEERRLTDDWPQGDWPQEDWRQ